MKKTGTENQKTIRSRHGFYFILSLLLHGLLVIILLLNPSWDPSRSPRKVTEVELIDPEVLLKTLERHRKQEPQGQIVEQDEKAINDETPENAKFMSRHNQRVLRETQATVHGKFKNTQDNREEKPLKQAKVPKPKAPRLQNKAAEEILADNQRDLGDLRSRVKPKLKDLIPSFKPVAPPPENASDETDELAQGGDGPSATDDHLKNVSPGIQTLLSTREFVYYTYYNRIKDKLRQYWEPKIKEKLERVFRQGRTIASDTDRITRVVIILDGTGTLIRVQVIGPSGLTDLDEAAIEAFRAAAPFPNPPKGIVEADGTIKIRWDFILEANASSLFNAMRL